MSTTKLIGYAAPLSVFAGRSSALHISSNGPSTCDISVYRIVCGDPDPVGPGQVFEAMAWGGVRTKPVQYQAVNSGSYGIIEADFPLIPDDTVVIEFRLWPTLRSENPQALLSWYGNGTSIVVVVSTHGRLELFVNGNSAGELPDALYLRHWYSITITLNRRSGSATLDLLPLRRLGRLPTTQSKKFDIGSWSPPCGHGTMLFAADLKRQDESRLDTRWHFNGKLESPAVRIGDNRRTYVEWDFSENIHTDFVTDVGPNGFDGKLRNLPTRAVTGSSWDGSVQCFNDAPKQYNAVHFHEDDLINCEWRASHSISVPADARSGYYIARLTAPGVQSDIPFFISVRPGKPRSPLLFIAATATYQSYANTHIKFDSLNTENLYEAVTQVSEDENYLNEHRELGLSHYDTHSDGSGVIYVSSLRPMLNMRPGLYTFNYLNDTHILKWMEDQGFCYDVATDEDLHQHGPQLLQGYQVVMTGSHPEYYSTPMWDALSAYQRGGGRHMYMGGNGFYWRIAYSERFPGVIENRRGIAGVRTWEGEPGEHHLAFTGEHGGLWRSVGRAPQSLVGVGFSATLFARSTYYQRTPESYDPKFQFVFNDVPDSDIGNFGFRGGGAVGMEIDRSDPDLGTPVGATILATSVDTGLGGLLSGEEFITTTRALDGLQNAKVRADMVFFETPKGGAVFSTGSIAWATSLLYNGGENNVSKISANVLHRFLSPQPFDQQSDD